MAPRAERKRLRVLIVDDERPARRDLRRQMDAYRALEVVGEAADVKDAAAVASRCRPDVIFLDIHMPGASGFELLDRLADPARVVFVTAYDQHAVRAFEVNAVDYLLKPVEPERLELTVQRLLGESVDDRAARRLEYGDRVFVNTAGGFRFLDVSAIHCIVAEDDRSRLLAGAEGEYVLPRPLKEWERRLPPEHFMRIHRSAIVNLNHVDRIEEWFSRTCRVHVRGLPDPLPMSQRFSARFRQRLPA